MPNLSEVGDYMDEEGMDLFGEKGKPPAGKKPPMPPMGDEPMGEDAMDIENLFKDKMGKGGGYEPPNEAPEHEMSESAITEALEVGLGMEITPEQAQQISAILKQKAAPAAPAAPAGTEKLRKLGGAKPSTPPPPPMV